jgi:hypothetical protein
VLVGFVLRGDDPPDQVDTVGPGTSGTAPAERATTPPSAEPRDAQPTSPAGSLVDLAADGALAWARSGECDGRAPRLRLAPDGATFETVEVPATSLLRVNAESSEVSWLVGTDDSCEPVFLRTTDGGATWTGPGDSADAWHLLPPGASDLHAPAGNVAGPCPQKRAPVDLAVFASEGAAVICADGTLHRTDDAGATWTGVGAAEVGTTDDGSTAGLHAVSFLDADRALGFTRDDAGCAGSAVVATTDGGQTWQPRGCADGADPDRAAIAVATAGEAVIADGNSLLTTADGGRTWEQVSTP